MAETSSRPGREEREAEEAGRSRESEEEEEEVSDEEEEEVSEEERKEKTPPTGDEEGTSKQGETGEEERKEKIMVGAEYQAAVPEGLSEYDEAGPSVEPDKLAWTPGALEPEEIQNYLTKALRKGSFLSEIEGVGDIPLGCGSRDDEQALYVLLQCEHDVEEALKRAGPPPKEKISPWTEEECRNFESGLRIYGKNFRLIQLHKVKTRSVGDLVQFYYLWKKTERHDIFASKARLGKTKYSLHPGITDFMDRFLDKDDDLDKRLRGPPSDSQFLIYADPKWQRNSSESAIT